MFAEIVKAFTKNTYKPPEWWSVLTLKDDLRYFDENNGFRRSLPDGNMRAKLTAAKWKLTGKK